MPFASVRKGAGSNHGESAGGSATAADGNSNSGLDTAWRMSGCTPKTPSPTVVRGESLESLSISREPSKTWSGVRCWIGLVTYAVQKYTCGKSISPAGAQASSAGMKQPQLRLHVAARKGPSVVHLFGTY